MKDYVAAGANGFGIGSSLYKSGKSLQQLMQDATELVALCADSFPASGRF
jgi:2-dehydro-3-deoxyphosphogalactonate aldolase